MKKFFVASLFFILILSLGTVNASNKINALSMDIYVDKSGDAHVTELWECYAIEKTEWYHTYKNIGNSQIENLSVSDENGNVFETLSNWDVDKDFYEKKNKCGINYINNGYELCFGISEYSTNKKYTVKYDITNFVAQINDSQIIYWTLMDFSQDIGKAYIKIYSDFEYEDTLDVWGFGNYGGTCYVYDGYIEMQSKGSLSSNEYMTILVKYPQNTFDITNNFYAKDFEEYLKMAEEGSTRYEDDEEVEDIIGGIVTTAIFVIIFVFAFANGSSTGKITSKKERKEVAKYKEYYRDIPCGKDIFKSYYISDQYNISKKKEDFLGAVFLKWIKEGRMTIQDSKDGKKKNLVLNEIEKEFENTSEKKLFIMVQKASKDGILESNEFEKWANKNYDSFLNWFERVSDVVKEKMVEDANSSAKFVDSSMIREDALELKGLKNYLNDYTKIADRGAIEVELFEEYLMYAQIFGIAKKVRKEFETLYPDLIEQTSIRSYNDLDYIWYMSNRTVTRAHTAKSAAEARARSYSSGGGGFSSGGGGGGSFGGGRRRLKIKV